MLYNFNTENLNHAKAASCCIITTKTRILAMSRQASMHSQQLNTFIVALIP